MNRIDELVQTIRPRFSVFEKPTQAQLNAALDELASLARAGQCNVALREAAQEMSLAQRAMQAGWSESTPPVQSTMWRRLHASGKALFEALEKAPPQPAPAGAVPERVRKWAKWYSTQGDGAHDESVMATAHELAAWVLSLPAPSSASGGGGEGDGELRDSASALVALTPPSTSWGHTIHQVVCDLAERALRKP